MELDRDHFALRQAEMTARWFENVVSTHGDVEGYIALRHKAYMDRWNEAGRFISPGSRVLDIGGGNLFPDLLRYFQERHFRYNYMDIDVAAVNGSRNLAEKMGFSDFKFVQGFNDALPFEDESFDAVFSSHCIEHSIDLMATLSEVNRVLPIGGNFMLAVPLGWELNPEHPYFFGPLEWVGFCKIAALGFE